MSCIFLPKAYPRKVIILPCNSMLDLKKISNQNKFILKKLTTKYLGKLGPWLQKPLAGSNTQTVKKLPSYQSQVTGERWFDAEMFAEKNKLILI